MNIGYTIVEYIRSGAPISLAIVGGISTYERKRALSSAFLGSGVGWLVGRVVGETLFKILDRKPRLPTNSVTLPATSPGQVPSVPQDIKNQEVFLNNVNDSGA